MDGHALVDRESPNGGAIVDFYHVKTPAGIKPGPSRVGAVMEVGEPMTKREMRQLEKFVQQVRDFAIQVEALLAEVQACEAPAVASRPSGERVDRYWRAE